jgi:4-amino-4-deoxy-L-arabinose transferase-like glycosyltransferase
MLQRIQTLYLLIALLISSVLYIWPIAFFGTLNDSVILYVKGLHNNAGDVVALYYPYVILSGIISFLLVFQILNYKKRIRQMQTGKVIITLCVLWYFMGGVYLFNYFKSFEDFQYGRPFIAVFAPILMIVFVFLANKNIKKDEDLVRSVDRIR